MRTISVNAEYLRLATLFTDSTGKYKDRPNLDAVRIEPHHDKGALIIATDCEHMIVIHDKDAQIEGTASVRVPAELRMELQGETIHERQFTYDEKTLTTAVWRGVEQITSMKAPAAVQFDTAYVTWKKLHPTLETYAVLRPGWPGAMNCDFLKKVAMLYKSMGAQREINFLTNGDKNGVFYLFFPWRPEMYVAIAQLTEVMPPRFPNWIDVEDIPF